MPGIEQVPASLPIFVSNASDHPFVMCIDSNIVAFINAHELCTRDKSHRMVFIEALRVAVQEKGKGLGTLIVEKAMESFTKSCPVETHIRFVATTLPLGPGCRIFEKIGCHLQPLVHLWPSTQTLKDVIELGFDHSSRTLHALGLEKLVPKEAYEAIPCWENVQSAQHISEIVDDFTSCGYPDMIIKRFSVDSLNSVLCFLDSKWAKREGRMIWKLHRSGKPTLLVLIRPTTHDPASPAMFCDVSAIAHDREGAEMVIAFMDSLEEMPFYMIAFDSKITVCKMKESPLLSSVSTSSFLVHELERHHVCPLPSNV